MMGWLFKKDDTPAAAAAAAASGNTADAVPAPAIDWQGRLDGAQGNEDALLALARERRAPVDVKLAAVSALSGEAALKLAEREFRDHDRRVHRLAKQRLQTQVAQRETHERAAQLIDAARRLMTEATIPTNRLVDLDQAWQTLDGSLIDAGQDEAFRAALAQLALLTRERGDAQLRLARWASDSQEALASLQAACGACAQGTGAREELAACIAGLRTALAAASDGEDGAALRQALQRALEAGMAIDERTAALDALLQASPGSEADVRWQQLAPHSDADLQAMLERRVEQWRQSHEDARQARRAQRRELAADTRRNQVQVQIDALNATLERAEASLAAGQLADTNARLVEIDEQLDGHAPPAGLRQRIEALQAEYARLRGWQHWGGGVARDDLVLQAEALASAIRGETTLPVAKLTHKQQAEVINELRARWKELDRLGGATSRSLWQRFDGALQAAYAPVAEHLAAQRNVREQNLLSRRQLIERLAAVNLPEDERQADWKAIASALESLHIEWRKLGPLEHTVPRKEQAGLQARLAAEVQRLETPLNKIRAAAQRTRERLIATAKALGTEPARDIGARVRELQAEWQREAKATPLARGTENALWGEFKGAIDAIFSAREAAFNAREAEFRAHGAARAALIERLSALDANTPVGELKRTLNEVESQWRETGPAPRSDAARLDADYRRALDAARNWLSTHDQRSWQASCDTLLARLAWCEEREHGSSEPEAAREIAERQGTELPALPSSWERALAQRGSATTGIAATELLLQLEAAWQLESPADHEAARRELKLRALKAALEGRSAKPATPTTPDQWLCAAIARTDFDAPQRARFKTVIAALRERRPQPRS